MPLPPPVPALPPDLLRARRAEVQALLRQAGGGHLLLPTMPQARRNADTEHPYRADSDLYWLTGFEEPEAVALLAAEGEKPFTLFVRPKDKLKEVWSGRRAGVEGAVAQFGADEAFPIDKLDEELGKRLGTSPQLWYRLGAGLPEFDARVARLFETLRAKVRLGQDAPARLLDTGWLLHLLRLRKRPEELNLIRRAVELTARGHRAAMRAGRPGAWEYELQAAFEYEVRSGGGRGTSFPTIVAAGQNATVLHYVENASQVRDGELVLVDAGGEVDLYAADVTRTFPASGRFSPAQRRAYDLVLSANDAAIAAAKPGATLDGLHDLVVRRMTEGMLELGLLKGGPADVETLIKENKYKRCYMHRTSHWLGLDVHDAGPYRTPEGAPMPLHPGMVFTVEPGLYIAGDDEEAPAEYRGIGIRIEDDVLVTEQGCEVLTRHIPRTVDEVEAACAR